MTENSHHQLYNFFIQNQKKSLILYVHDSVRLFIRKKKNHLRQVFLHLRNEIFMNTVSLVNASKFFLVEGLTAGAQMDLKTCSFTGLNQRDRQY